VGEDRRVRQGGLGVRPGAEDEARLRRRVQQPRHGALAKGEADKALWNFDQAIKSRPDYAEALNNRGQALSQIGDAEKALWNFDQALKAKPEYVAAQQAREEAHILRSGAVVVPVQATRP
jgi:Tfp pilus assembly protein PilF